MRVSGMTRNVRMRGRKRKRKCLESSPRPGQSEMVFKHSRDLINLRRDLGRPAYDGSLPTREGWIVNAFSVRPSLHYTLHHVSLMPMLRFVLRELASSNHERIESGSNESRSRRQDKFRGGAAARRKFRGGKTLPLYGETWACLTASAFRKDCYSFISWYLLTPY